MNQSPDLLMDLITGESSETKANTAIQQSFSSWAGLVGFKYSIALIASATDQDPSHLMEILLNAWATEVKELNRVYYEDLINNMNESPIAKLFGESLINDPASISEKADNAIDDWVKEHKAGMIQGLEQLIETLKGASNEGDS